MTELTLTVITPVRRNTGPALNGRSVGISERISKFSLCPAGVAARAAANPIEQSSLPGHPRERDQEVGYEVLWLLVLANAPCLTPQHRSWFLTSIWILSSPRFRSLYYSFRIRYLPCPTAYSEHLRFSSLVPIRFQHFTPPGVIAIDDGRSFNGNPVIIITSVLGGCRRGECSSVGRDVGTVQ